MFINGSFGGLTEFDVGVWSLISVEITVDCCLIMVVRSSKCKDLTLILEFLCLDEMGYSWARVSILGRFLVGFKLVFDVSRCEGPRLT